MAAQSSQQLNVETVVAVDGNSYTLYSSQIPTATEIQRHLNTVIRIEAPGEFCIEVDAALLETWYSQTEY